MLSRRPSLHRASYALLRCRVFTLPFYTSALALRRIAEDRWLLTESLHGSGAF